MPGLCQNQSPPASFRGRRACYIWAGRPYRDRATTLAGSGLAEGAAWWRGRDDRDGFRDLHRHRLESCQRFNPFSLKRSDPPAITRVHAPAVQDRAREAVRKIGAAVLAKGDRLPAKLVQATAREAALLKARIKDTPTAAILAAAGDHAEDHATRHRKAMAESRDRTDAQRQAEADRVDGWLRSQLEDGPVPAEVVRKAAERKGIPVRGGGDGLSLHDAAGRVGVVGCQRSGEGREGAVYWCTGRVPDGFELPREPLRMAR